jgi:hypothetical protein
MKSKNPFNRNRAEQMGDDTWRYYVKTSSLDLLSEKPLIFEGSRGCGKTMFFVCNSWKERVLEFESKAENLESLFGTNNFVGFYYKVDGKFVGRNLSGKGIEDWIWQSIFNTYFNIIIGKEIISFIETCLHKKIVTQSQISDLLGALQIVVLVS